MNNSVLQAVALGTLCLIYAGKAAWVMVVQYLIPLISKAI